MRTIYVESCATCGCPVLVTDDAPGAVVNRLAGECANGGCGCHPEPVALVGADRVFGGPAGLVDVR